MRRQTVPPDPRMPAQLSVEQVASLLRVSRMTATRFRDPAHTPADLLLRAVKTDGVWRVNRRDLADWVNRNTVTPEGEERIRVTADDIPRAMTLEEAAEKSGLSLWWLRNGCAKRLLPHLRAGKARTMLPEHVRRAQEIATQQEQEVDELAADRRAYASGRRATRTPGRRAA